jgi:diguanylate cyclase (GGDEF)-like protein
MIRPRWGQIVLAAVLVVTVVTIVVTSFVASQAHSVEKSTVFSEEADATAMTFVQRESFGVLLAIDSWARGSSTARDVQIARALLGQRLSVMVSSGRATYELTGENYQTSLATIDGVIGELKSIPDPGRLAYRDQINIKTADFATQTRELSNTFQALLRAQVQAALDDRVRAERWLSGLSVLAFVLGGALFAWFAIDINIGYRRSARELAAQTSALERTRERLILFQRIDERGRAWLAAANAGAPREEVFDSIRREIAEIVPGLQVDVRYDHVEPIRVITRADSALTEEDDEALIARAVETVRLLIVRDSGEEELEFQRIHDSLTGLPNRLQFDPLIAAELEGASNDTSVVAVMLVDIDRFSDFNGSLGHEAGDALLLSVTTVLRDAAPEAVHLARLSSDEFGLVGTFRNDAAAVTALRAIADAVDFEWTRDEVSTHVTASAGLAIARSGDEAGIVIQRAAAAIRLAKSKGDRAAFVLFKEEAHEKLLTTMHEESALRAAMRANEFVVFFQPIMNLHTDDLAGVEALVRWDRPGVGIVFPDDFLPAVARAGLAAELGWEVIEQALGAWGRTLRSDSLDNRSGEAAYVSINVDPAQLDIPHLADFIIATARRHRVPSHSIVIEVTEHALAGSALAIGQLAELRRRGIRIALDDFGTGYSSLAQASTLPLDILKIDKGFVPRGMMLEQSRRLIGDICAIGATLNLLVTAEGVETEMVAESLRELGVIYGQGYLFSKALPERELTNWLAERQAPIEPIHHI